jgi:hypothetical protein
VLVCCVPAVPLQGELRVRHCMQHVCVKLRARSHRPVCRCLLKMNFLQCQQQCQQYHRMYVGVLYACPLQGELRVRRWHWDAQDRQTLAISGLFSIQAVRTGSWAAVQAVRTGSCCDMQYKWYVLPVELPYKRYTRAAVVKSFASRHPGT